MIAWNHDATNSLTKLTLSLKKSVISTHSTHSLTLFIVYVCRIMIKLILFSNSKRFNRCIVQSVHLQFLSIPNRKKQLIGRRRRKSIDRSITIAARRTILVNIFIPHYLSIRLSLSSLLCRSSTSTLQLCLCFVYKSQDFASIVSCSDIRDTPNERII